MDDNTMVPTLAILCIFGLPVAAYIVNRTFKHQERMELLRRGIIPPPDLSDKRAYKAWRKAGSPWPPPGGGWQQPGPAWQPGVVPPGPPPGWSAPDDDPQSALRRGIVTTCVGAAIFIGLSFIGGTPGSAGFHFGPWLLGGLIPMFVGIAQIIIALLSGAVLPGAMSANAYYVPPPGPAGPHPAPGAPQPPPGYAPGAPPPPGYAPGAPPPWADAPGRPRFEELSKPINPPDVR